MVSENNSIVKYSDVVVIGAANDEFEISSIVNPFSDHIRAEVVSGKLQQVTIQLTDMFGRIIYEEKKMLNAGRNTVNVAVPATMQKANYLFKMFTQEKAVQRMMMKN
jgi:hypothetical protein